MDSQVIPATALEEIDFRLSLLRAACPGDAPLPQVAQIEQFLSMVSRAPLPAR